MRSAGSTAGAAIKQKRSETVPPRVCLLVGASTTASRGCARSLWRSPTRGPSGRSLSRNAIAPPAATSVIACVAERSSVVRIGGAFPGRRSSRHPETRGPAEAIVSSGDVGASMQPRRLLVVESRLTESCWLAGRFGRQPEAGDVGNARAMCASWVKHSEQPGRRWRSASPGRRCHRAPAMALRVPRDRALGDLHPRRRRRESNGFLTRAVEVDGMRVQ